MMVLAKRMPVALGARDSNSAGERASQAAQRTATRIRKGRRAVTTGMGLRMHDAPGRLEWQRAGQARFYPRNLVLARGDDDDSVRAAHAVERRRRGVLEHVDPHHVLRVERRERAAGSELGGGRAVDHDERVVVAGGGADAANLEAERAVLATEDPHPRCTSLDELLDTGVALVSLFVLHLRVGGRPRARRRRLIRI